MTSSLTRRIERAEAATAMLADEARVYDVASLEIAERMWFAAKEAGRRAGLFVVRPGQAEPIIVGPTISELVKRVAEFGRRIHDKDQPPFPDDGSRLWREPKPDSVQLTL